MGKIKEKIENENKIEQDISKEKNDKSAEKSKKKHTAIKVICIILIILILIFTALYFTYYFYRNYQLELTKTEIASLEAGFIVGQDASESIEYGTEINYQDLVKKFISEDTSANYELKVNGKTLNKDDSYKFMQLGENIVSLTLFKEDENKRVFKIDLDKLTYTYEPEKYMATKEIKFTVNDTALPVIEGVSDKEITVGDEIDLKAGITAKDIVDGDLEFTVEGTVDNNTVGEYKITVKAVDKNGNETTSEFKVNVKEKKVTSSSSTASSNRRPSNNTSSSSNSGSNTSSSNNNSGKLGVRYSTSSGADSETISVAKQIISEIITPGMSGKQKVIAISRWMLNNVGFGSGRTARGALIDKSAACSGFARGTLLLCQQAGLYAEHVNYSLWTHQYVRVWADGQKYVIDDAIQIGGDCVYSSEEDYRNMIISMYAYPEGEF